MAEDKGSFVLYADQKDLFEELPDEKAGQLIKHIFAYINDENPETEDLILKIAFSPIKNQLKRDLKKWERAKDSKSEGGKIGNLKRWHPDLYKAFKEGKKTLQECLITASNRMASHTDRIISDTDTDRSHSIASVAVNVNDNVNVNVPVNEKYNINDFKKDFLKHGVSKGHLDDWIAARKAKRASTFTQTVYNSFVKQCEKAKVTIPDAVELCAGSSWITFKAEYLENKKNRQEESVRLSAPKMKEPIVPRNGEVKSVSEMLNR